MQESEKYHAFFLCILVHMKRTRRGAHQTNLFCALRGPQNANPSWMRMVGQDCEQSLKTWVQVLFYMYKTARWRACWKKTLIAACCSIFAAYHSPLHFSSAWTAAFLLHIAVYISTPSDSLHMDLNTPETSRQKASWGQRFPCPASLKSWGLRG